MVVETTTTDKNGRTIGLGDYVHVVNRTTGFIEDSGYVSKIDGKQVYLDVVYENGKGVNTVYYSDNIVVKKQKTQ
jgi:hypothetical protein